MAATNRREQLEADFEARYGCPVGPGPDLRAHEFHNPPPGVMEAVAEVLEARRIEQEELGGISQAPAREPQLKGA
jgi:hypothetical protein